MLIKNYIRSSHFRFMNNKSLSKEFIKFAKLKHKFLKCRKEKNLESKQKKKSAKKHIPILRETKRNF